MRAAVAYRGIHTRKVFLQVCRSIIVHIFTGIIRILLVQSVFVLPPVGHAVFVCIFRLQNDFQVDTKRSHAGFLHGVEIIDRGRDNRDRHVIDRNRSMIVPRFLAGKGKFFRRHFKSRQSGLVGNPETVREFTVCQRFQIRCKYEPFFAVFMVRDDPFHFSLGEDLFLTAAAVDHPAVKQGFGFGYCRKGGNRAIDEPDRQQQEKPYILTGGNRLIGIFHKTLHIPGGYRLNFLKSHRFQRKVLYPSHRSDLGFLPGDRFPARPGFFDHR